MTKGQFLTASYYAEIVMSSKQLKFSTLRKLHDLSKLRQDLLKKYQEIETLGKEKEIEESEITENQNEFLSEEYTESFNPIYANTIDNLESEELPFNDKTVNIMECLFIMLGNNLIKE